MALSRAEGTVADMSEQQTHRERTGNRRRLVARVLRGVVGSVTVKPCTQGRPYARVARSTATATSKVRVKACLLVPSPGTTAQRSPEPSSGT